MVAFCRFLVRTRNSVERNLWNCGTVERGTQVQMSRSTATGSVCATRRAGTMHAIVPTITSTSGATPKLIQSCVDTP